MRRFHPRAMRIIAASALTLALSACASTPDPIVEDRSRCDAYGFQRGTDAYANCVLTQDRDRERRYDRQAGQRPSRPERPYSSEEE
ncbi:hypothetical protein B6S44_05490 [Bosea sp. Tri-44]|nr:hypothetical protein B6S44_05490 [Bosea sp. Tri-44]